MAYVSAFRLNSNSCFPCLVLLHFVQYTPCSPSLEKLLAKVRFGAHAREYPYLADVNVFAPAPVSHQ